MKAKTYNHSFFTPYEVTRNCAVFIDKVEYVLVDTNDEGHWLVKERERTEGTPEFFPHHKLYRMIFHEKRAHIEANLYSPEMIELRRSRGNKPESMMGERQQARCEYFAGLFKQFETEKLKNGQKGHVKVTTGKVSLDYWLPIFHERVMKNASVNLFRHVKEEKVWMPSDRNFLTVYNQFLEYRRHPLSLTTDHHGPGERKTDDCAKSVAIWVGHVNGFAADKRPEKEVVYRSIVADIRAQNENLDPRDHLQEPTKNMVRTMVDALDSYFVLAGRHGPEFARREFKLSASGIQVERPGERLEMDEWETDLLTILEATRYYEHFPRGDRRRAKKTRVWVTAIIDTMTRYILALKFSLAPSARTALDAIEMMLMDKTEFGRTLGCQTPWHGACGGFFFVTDQGSAFTSWEVTEALAGIECHNVKPAAGEPEKRGFIEALFNALKHFLRYLDGQTFASVWEKNDYDPAAKANVTIDFLNKYLVRAVVDVYHNQEHSNLLDESPHVRWTRITQKMRPVPVPSNEKRRIYFGLKDTRVASENGILVLGIRYQCPELGDFVLSRGKVTRDDFRESLEVDIRIDKWCMREISYFDTNLRRWVTARSTCNLPVGISAAELIESARQMVKENRAANAHNAQIRWRTINDLRLSGLAAAARAELGDEKVTIEYLRDQEKKQKKVFQHTLEEQWNIDLSPIAHPGDVLKVNAHDRSGIVYEELKDMDEGEALPTKKKGNPDEPVAEPIASPVGPPRPAKKYQLRYRNEEGDDA